MKRVVVVMALSLLALLVPASGLAAPSTVVTPTWNLFTTPIPARHGYTLGITVSKTGENASVNFLFEKKRGAAKQDHNYFFKLHASDFRCSSSLSTCSVTTGKELGRYGMLRMNFRSNHRGKRVKPPTGCTGTDIDRTGTLSGSFDFRANTNFFGRRHRRRLRGTANVIQLQCAPSTSFCHTTQLSDFTPTAYSNLLARNVGRGSGSFSFTDPSATSAPATVSRIIRVTNMRSGNFAFAPDLSSATFTGNGLPWISGGFTYTAGGPASTSPSACGGPGSYTNGIVKSTLSANLDVVGTKSFPPTTTGFLQHYP